MPQKPQPLPASSLPIADLATELSTTVPRLWMLIEHGYLRLIEKTDSCFTTTVERPGPAAFAWLRNMLAPLPNRPLLPLSIAAEFYALTTQEARALCLAANVQFQMDPVFGEVMSLSGYRDLGEAVYCARHPLSFDRAMLVTVFRNLLLHPQSKARAVPVTASARLEREIQRIAAMKEPARTVRATEFFAAYTDARTVVSAGMTQEPGETLKRLDKQMKRMKSAIMGRTSKPWNLEVKTRKKRHRKVRKFIADRPYLSRADDGSFSGAYRRRAITNELYAVPQPPPPGRSPDVNPGRDS